MSSAAAEAAPEGKKGGAKKLIIIIVAAVLLLVVLGGAGAFFLMKKKPAEGEDGEDGGDATEQVEKHAEAKHGDKKAPPVFVPLEPFTVNLADTGADRYLQVGVTLELADAHVGEDIKLYMPAIRNAILMILSHKTSEELTTTEGKEKLSEEIRVGTARSMGIEIAEPEAADADEDTGAKKKKKKKKKAEVENPILHVHYSNFIIQ
ncbi:MAG: flagellar basal body rod protein [Aquabacterium sp.]|nr:MAG: flagellar basal body rod protein [Aquabacterium sp.]